MPGRQRVCGGMPGAGGGGGGAAAATTVDDDTPSGIEEVD